ncbi:MAG: hypothetical protein L0387_27705 [Acidobacteria bacterium]|nr:hypothetical protein [Acidobacteriota bacterium]MCI0625388.1 hypothetical protein [Acidobacteriota bacterium]MCI0721031.1 hypothetical protein [Acidobacteriota bacterium]
MAKFRNREEAGHQLSGSLVKFQNDQPLVMPVLNGGVLTALPVAQALKAPLLPVPMRSLRIPWDQETIFGYVTHQGTLHLNQALVGQVRLTLPEIHQIARKQRLALQMDLNHWGVVLPNTLDGKTVLLVDDGMHSGWTMFSAAETVKPLGATQVVVAVPVTHFRAKRFLGRHCNEVVALLTEDIALYEIRNYYDDFPELESDHVRELLKAAFALQTAA